MSRGEGENPLDFSWTSESQEAQAEEEMATPVDRANNPARKYKAKHAKTDKKGRPVAPNESPSDNFIPREGRHERKPF